MDVFWKNSIIFFFQQKRHHKRKFPYTAFDQVRQSKFEGCFLKASGAQAKVKRLAINDLYSRASRSGGFCAGFSFYNISDYCKMR